MLLIIALHTHSVIPKMSFLCDDCDHTHNQSCLSCEQLKSVLREIKAELLATNINDEECDSILFLYQQSAQAIKSWKAHQLRSIQQDKAWTCRLDELDSTSILITQDWAMKFLPQRYRKTQKDWFCSCNPKVQSRKRNSCCHRRPHPKKSQERPPRDFDSISTSRQCRMLPQCSHAICMSFDESRNRDNSKESRFQWPPRG